MAAASEPRSGITYSEKKRREERKREINHPYNQFDKDVYLR